MSPLPVNEEFTLRYIAEIPQNNDLAGVPGGMYVSAELGLNRTLYVAAPIPGYFDHQTWKFGEPTHRGIQILCVPHTGSPKDNSVGALGFHNRSEVPGSQITLGPASYYHIEIKAEIHGGKIVVIRPTGHMIGMDYYVGVNQDNHVRISLFDP
ncbi:peptidase inhibitor clitocypin domain-containing protein [Ceratobasidium sp. AG-Ba]|nr:peptidase inhibitor clitocypin domain-containing protein [Ceratobasidium sp. AG-Ba]QRW08896.1 peptidase inhibitor clitocypin domain-containing protein [Ceratobasidium sp. AG-Ba]